MKAAASKQKPKMRVTVICQSGGVRSIIASIRNKEKKSKTTFAVFLCILEHHTY